MKLYTEQQVEEAYLSGRFTRLSFEEVLKEYTPIKLPTDEEIGERSYNWSISNDPDMSIHPFRTSWKAGAKWVIVQIQKQK